LLRRASRLLNDDVTDKDTVRWEFATLVDFLNEGAAHMQSLRPDIFVESVDLEITDACPQRLPDKYDSLVAIDKVIEKGPGGRTRVVNEVIEESHEFAKHVETICSPGVGPSNCTPTSNGVKPSVLSFSKTAESLKEFYVSPPIPFGKSVTVKARVVKQAPCFCADNPKDCVDIPTKLHAALIDWVVHRAYSMDIESEFAYRSSQRYEASFYRFIGNGYMQEARFGSGYFNGKEGQGDENATPRSTGIR
jgi:hypothetical protein